MKKEFPNNYNMIKNCPAEWFEPIEFNTAWSPPEAICNAIRELYEDVSVSLFYDEPGCEIAGYL